jgi:hypothetical protein
MWNVRQLRTSSKCWLQSLKIRDNLEDNEMGLKGIGFESVDWVCVV